MNNALNTAAAALGKDVDRIAAENRQFLAALRLLPNGEESLSRELAKLNLTPEEFERILAGEVSPANIESLLGSGIQNS